MKVSPDGTQFCQTGYPHFEPDSNYFQLFDFDNASGILSNAKVISNLTNTGWPYYSCEFSPDSRFIYVSTPTGDFIDQFEAKHGSAADINASRISVPATGGILGTQRGPDGKIYLNHQEQFLSVISQPNIKGTACNFELRKINLGNKNGGYGLPAVINDGFTHPFNTNSGINIQAPPGQTIEAGQSVQLYVSGGGTSFLWAPPQWLNNPAIQSPVATPAEDIIYTVTAINDIGCKAVDSVAIHVATIDGIYVPTGFTPFNDGRNEVFRPVIGLQYTLEEFSVYNRWGQKVFSTHENGKGWDGRVKGQKQNTGIYVWFVRAKALTNKKIEKKGTVMLIK
jgi:gliding motility-associated-like protein